MHIASLGWIAAAMIALPSLAALAEREQDVVSDHTLRQTLARIGHEGKATFLRWEAIPYTLTCMFPMGSGAMIQLLPVSPGIITSAATRWDGSMVLQVRC